MRLVAGTYSGNACDYKDNIIRILSAIELIIAIVSPYINRLYF
ncbi:SSU ribosomal protein S8E [Giardia duodenalis]|uniref:SSU ribosomal protein S8E n=1 Tax=Giardia intestinalis TaxID=5741 RepID=V6U0B5_GIAIN|nr:SSU ribosomal protein S8E [Giardia intestinalis]